jgi:hypothetical protein
MFIGYHLRIVLAVVGLLFVAYSVAAHDRSGKINWIMEGGFRSPIDGSGCCGMHDCVELPSEEVRYIGGLDPGYVWRRHNNAGSVQEFIPQQEVQNSRDGNYWRCKKPDGSRRCFFAPPSAV